MIAAALPMIQPSMFFSLRYARGSLRFKMDVVKMPSPPAHSEMRSGAETSFTAKAIAIQGIEKMRIAM